MARAPIVCALSADDAGTRVDEWRQLLNEHVAAVERRGQLARFRLNDSDDALLAAVDLARREKACCPFFELRLVPLPETVWLEVEAPESATAVLDELVSLYHG